MTAGRRPVPMTIDDTKLPFHWTGDAWILQAAERRANTLDDYWNEPSWTDLSADPSHRLLHVIKPMLHYGL